MVWDPSKPAEGAALLSAPIRANWEALDPLIGPDGNVWPLLAPDITGVNAPSYSFANDPAVGLVNDGGWPALLSRLGSVLETGDDPDRTGVGLTLMSGDGLHGLYIAASPAYDGSYIGSFSTGNRSLNFATSDTTRWKIPDVDGGDASAVGHFLPAVDNAYDLGDATHRIKSFHYGTQILAPDGVPGVAESGLRTRDLRTTRTPRSTGGVPSYSFALDPTMGFSRYVHSAYGTGMVFSDNYMGPIVALGMIGGGATAGIGLPEWAGIGWSAGDDPAYYPDLIIGRGYTPGRLDLSRYEGPNSLSLYTGGITNGPFDRANVERAVLSAQAGLGVTLGFESLGTGADNLSITLAPLGTGQVFAPNGSATAPAYSFTSAPSVGMMALPDFAGTGNTGLQWIDSRGALMRFGSYDDGLGNEWNVVAPGTGEVVFVGAGYDMGWIGTAPGAHTLQLWAGWAVWSLVEVGETGAAHFLPEADNLCDLGDLTHQVRALYVGNDIRFSADRVRIQPQGADPDLGLVLVDQHGGSLNLSSSATGTFSSVTKVGGQHFAVQVYPNVVQLYASHPVLYIKPGGSDGGSGNSGLEIGDVLGAGYGIYVRSGGAFMGGPNASLWLLTMATPPPAPPAGYVALYPKADKKLYIRNDIGGESALGVSWPLLAPDGLVTAPSYSFLAQPDTGLYRGSSGGITMVGAGTDLVHLGYNTDLSGLTLHIGGMIGWSAAGSPRGATDIKLQRAAPGVLAQWNGTDARQEYRIQNAGNAWLQLSAYPTFQGIAAINQSTPVPFYIQNATLGHLYFGTNGELHWYFSGAAGDLGHFRPTGDTLYDLGGIGYQVRHAYVGQVRFNANRARIETTGADPDVNFRFWTQHGAMDLAGYPTGTGLTVYVPGFTANIGINADAANPSLSASAARLYFTPAGCNAGNFSVVLGEGVPWSGAYGLHLADGIANLSPFLAAGPRASLGLPHLPTPPPMPPAGYTLLYAKADKRFYAKDDTGVENPVLTTFPLLAPDYGSAGHGSPSYAFAAATNTGLERDRLGYGELDLEVDGQLRVAVFNALNLIELYNTALSFVPDNARDLGHGGERPRNIYFGSQILAPTTSDAYPVYPTYAWTNDINTGLSSPGAGTIDLAFGGHVYWQWQANHFAMRSGVEFGWSNGIPGARATTDVVLVRDGPGILALKNGENPQRLRVYEGAGKYLDLAVSPDYHIVQSVGGASLLLGSSNVILLQGTSGQGWYVWSSGTIFPTSDNVLDVGTPSMQVHDLHLGGAIKFNNNKVRIGPTELSPNQGLMFQDERGGYFRFYSTAPDNSAFTWVNPVASGQTTLSHYGWASGFTHTAPIGFFAANGAHLAVGNALHSHPGQTGVQFTDYTAYHDLFVEVGAAANLRFPNLAAAPATPPAGYTSLYVKASDKRFYAKTDAGVENPVIDVIWPLLAPMGTVAAPSYTFAADTTTGLYLIGTNVLGVTGHLWPGTDKQWALGWPDHQWKDLWLSGAIFFGGMQSAPFISAAGVTPARAIQFNIEAGPYFQMLGNSATDAMFMMAAGSRSTYLYTVPGVSIFQTTEPIIYLTPAGTANLRINIGGLPYGGKGLMVEDTSAADQIHSPQLWAGADAGLRLPLLVTAPGTPYPGFIAIYGKADKKLYQKNDAGVESGLLDVNWPLLAPNGTMAAPSYAFASTPDTGMYSVGSGYLNFVSAGTNVLHLDANGPSAVAAYRLGASPGVPDVILARTGPGSLAMQDGENPQTFSIRGGGGYMSLSNGGAVAAIGANIGASTTKPFQIRNWATGPGSIIYFNVGGNNVWEFTDVGGHFLPGADTTYDIGGAGRRIRNLHFGSQILAPNGVVAAPSYSFAASPNTGLYQESDNLLLAAAGVRLLGIGSGGVYSDGPKLVIRNLVGGVNVGAVLSSPGDDILMLSGELRLDQGRLAIRGGDTAPHRSLDMYNQDGGLIHFQSGGPTDASFSVYTPTGSHNLGFNVSASACVIGASAASFYMTPSGTDAGNFSIAFGGGLLTGAGGFAKGMMLQDNLGGLHATLAAGAKAGLYLPALATAPAAPPTGYLGLYAKSDKRWYAKDDAGVEKAQVGGTGVFDVVALTQAAYDALGTKVATTLYVITT